MSAWGTAQRRPRKRAINGFQALKGRHYSKGIAESGRPFRAWFPRSPESQGGAARLCRFALPWADMGLPFQGEEPHDSVTLLGVRQCSPEEYLWAKAPRMHTPPRVHWFPLGLGSIL